jgi:hypothetical protein
MHAQEAHSVANLEAIEAALLGDAIVEAVAGRVHYGGAHVATGCGPRHQHSADISFVQVAHEGSAKEASGTALGNDDVGGLWGNGLDDGVTQPLVRM